MMCDLCGKKTNKLYTVIIEGIKLQVCEECAKYGRIVEEREREEKEESIGYREEEDLEEDWVEKVRNAIEERSKGRELEEVAKEIGIKKSLLRGILEGRVEISIETAKKIEKSLGIRIVRKERIESGKRKKKKIEEPMVTLGDIVKIRVRS